MQPRTLEEHGVNEWFGCIEPAARRTKQLFDEPHQPLVREGKLDSMVTVSIGKTNLPGLVDPNFFNRCIGH
jgi:hypothetical protein